MKILYFGSACDKEWFNKISSEKAQPYHVAQYMFEMALIEGFSNFQNIDMKIYYLYQEQYFPKGKLFFFKARSKKLNDKYMVNYLPNINLPILKELYFILVGMVLTLKWAINNRKEKNKLILTAFNYTPLSLGIYVVAKTLGIIRVNIFTDLSSHIINDQRQKDMFWLKKLILPYYLKIINFIEKSYDGYILFTEPMNSKVNPNHKPYIVIEGIFNNELNLAKAKKEKAIMYAGTLSFEYGVKNILDAFEQINDKNLQLWLFGNGDMKQYILELSQRDKRVKYFGFMKREDVFEYEKKATLLINLRNSNDEYTMYSFPSKTFEYMVSGTPFLTTKLKGIPDEYYRYVYTIDKLDIQSIKNKIEEILNKSQSELDDLGSKAREFILKEKNNKVQTTKIINFISQLFKCKK